MGLGAGPLWPLPQPYCLIFLVNYMLAVYTFMLYVKFFIRWEALYIRSDVIRSDVIRWEALYIGKLYTF
jgi:hypothetical protein